jgi:hypothetical protein
VSPIAEQVVVSGGGVAAAGAFGGRLVHDRVGETDLEAEIFRGPVELLEEGVEDRDGAMLKEPGGSGGGVDELLVDALGVGRRVEREGGWDGGRA